MQLRNLFLLNTPVAQMLLTPRWVSRRKDVKHIFINIYNLKVGGTYSISRRAKFSPNPHLVEEVPIFLSLHVDIVQTELRRDMPFQGPKCYIPLESTCCLFVAYCYDLRKLI